MSSGLLNAHAMGSTDELWGTFAVDDHLRERAFVAEIVLFDRLVVPEPPRDDPDQRKEWINEGWQPDRLEETLKRVGDLAIPIPWDKPLREKWRAQYRALNAGERAALRLSVTSDALADLHDIKQANPSAPAMNVTRRVIAKKLAGGFGALDPVADEALYRKIKELDIDPTANIEAVVGYGSYDRFHEEVPMELSFQSQTPTPSTSSPRHDTALLFRWNFLVPEDSSLKDVELLERAVRLSNKSEFRDSRRQFHEWRRKLIAKRVTIETARSEMDRCLRVYNDIVDYKRERSRMLTALQIVATTAPLIDFAVPTAGTATSVAFGLGAFLLDMVVPLPEPTARDKIAALVHDSREAFGWHNPTAL